jgi:transcriptional regulator of acetoin/glycerol metabolism
VILNALQECSWNEEQAARKLGVAREMLQGRIRLHGVVVPKS